MMMLFIYYYVFMYLFESICFNFHKNQFLEEARNHKRETTAARSSVDSLHFKLQKPISKEESANRKIHKANNKKKKWWRNALLFFKWKWIHSNHKDDYLDRGDVHIARARAFGVSVSGPVYLTDSLSGSSTPYRSTSRPSSGPLAGTLIPARKDDLEIPYLSLRELNMEQQQRSISTSAMPIYLVT
ncbi:hypothetical protein OIU78_007582 [Salix suchowensis]|uniref:Uncharacterized protein n=1 Tax=Salix koriyanagi TaxID=2511006 RepID=A0A9Q0WPK9_9ROSI|nr:hypothetical protein OIU78_007582 [Salix suchowensis]KAJ6769420.1 hypothetical protein OIU74_022972 [Salix koriyanagi]